MLFEYAVSSAPPLAVVRGFGLVDEQMCQDVLREIANDRSFSKGAPILIDAAEMATATEEVARAFAREWPTQMPNSRGAIVTTRDVAVTFGEEIKELSRRRLRMFGDADVALDGFVRNSGPAAAEPTSS